MADENDPDRPEDEPSPPAQGEPKPAADSGDQARDAVRAASGRGGHDELHRLGGPGLRLHTGGAEE